MDRLEELRKMLRKRGAKAKIHKETGLSLNALYKVESGTNTPLPTTRRLIATALGLPPHHFLDEQPEPESPTTRRVIIELDIPQDFNLTNDRLDQIRDAMVDAGTHIINIIKKMDEQA
jgi:transcriptional regulator with XRE-family HTH domain